MNRTAVVLLALGCFLGFGPGNVQAELITFDNLSAGLPIPPGYGELTWSRNLSIVNAAQFGIVPVTPPNTLFTVDGGASQGDARITSAGPGMFTFVGADFAGLGVDVAITAFGIRSGNTAYEATFTLHPGTFTSETLNFQNIDTLILRATPLGPPGVPDPDAPYLIDNLRTGAETAPEPGSLLLFGIGLAGTGLAAVRGRHRKPIRV